MNAIFKREFKSYFQTPIGFIVLAAYYFFLGLFFSLIYKGGSPSIETVIMATSIVSVFTMPILTMRLMSEDRRQKVDQALITAPVKLTSIVLGKFFAAFAVFALSFAPTVIFEIIIATKVSSCRGSRCCPRPPRRGRSGHRGPASGGRWDSGRCAPR